MFVLTEAQIKNLWKHLSNVSFNEHDEYKVVITSIGRALPNSIVSIAKGMNVPVKQVAERIYRAPTTLADKLSLEIAQQLRKLLIELGYGVNICSQKETVFTAKSDLDVSLYISDITQYAEVITRTAQFIGSTFEEAEKMVACPPGIILGGVTQATVDALISFLGEGAEIIASNKDDAIFDLYLTQNAETSLHYILSDLKRMGVNLISNNGCIARDISPEDAKAIWARHAKTGAVRIINQDFLRCDVVLTAKPDVLSPEQKDYFLSSVGIPEEYLETVFENTPVTLFEGEPFKNAVSMLADCHALDLKVEAELITFSQYGVQVVNGPKLKSTIATLKSMGFLDDDEHPQQYPFSLNYYLPELRARLLESKLSELQIDVELIDIENPGD